MKYIVEYKPLLKGASKQIPTSIVLHSMAEYILYDTDYIHAYDFLAKIELSAHALVCPDGTMLRCREDTAGAYHAKGYNKDSLGVEFLVEGNYNYPSFIETIKKPYLTFEQYVTGVELVRDWCSKYDIKSIVTHSSLSPKRKKDPGRGFPLEQFLLDIKRG